MKPHLNASKKTQTIRISFLVTGVYRPKTSCNSVIANLKHKLLSSESTIRKLKYQIKQLKNE